jgi:nucleotide-binding universal stress UspA family protein
MKILLAVDGSKYSDAATQAVIAQFSEHESEIKVLNVLQPTEFLGYPVMASESDKKQAQELVDGTARTLRTAGFRADSAGVIVGDARTSIIDTADEWHPDLIVMGSHGRSVVKRLLLGSVSEAVLHHARCSVQIVRLLSLPNSTDDARLRQTEAADKINV